MSNGFWRMPSVKRAFTGLELLRICAYDDDRNIGGRVVALQLSQCFGPGHLRHRQIEQDEVWPVFLRKSRAGCAVGRLFDSVARAWQQIRQN
jgi:hypothetical protein